MLKISQLSNIVNHECDGIAEENETSYFNALAKNSRGTAFSGDEKNECILSFVQKLCDEKIEGRKMTTLYSDAEYLPS